MAIVEVEKAEDLALAQAHVWKHIFNFINSMALKCACDLGIPDVIANHGGRPVTLTDLATALSIPAVKTDCLRRLMRILGHNGFFVRQTNGEGGEETYLLTPSSKLLVKDNPLNLLDFIEKEVHPVFVSSWHYFSEWFKTTEQRVFKMAHGVSLWEYNSQHPEMNTMFNAGMASDARILMNVVVSKCPEVYQGLNSLVDVGGGTGTAARIVAEAFPNVKCSVYDLPHVVATLPKNDIIQGIGGSMFESIPSAHAVQLKWVLHDWSDEECVVILQNAKKAIPSREEGGKVIILDIVVVENADNLDLTETQFLLDVLVMDVGGKERTEHEWKKLFKEAGFTDYKIKPVLGVRSIIEVYP
ncbi:pluviatolide O-methyltransferase-like [Telopea speciosissima]|uniref:pluviatolide O-methyltransferase-like n=1 Tax=Telopea speciosissima TaxID=54955 RepID=UPI001CC54E5D|nr:pluviatolide O-methyltransferase-like [Telopea speciosissima]